MTSGACGLRWLCFFAKSVWPLMSAALCVRAPQPAVQLGVVWLWLCSVAVNPERGLLKVGDEVAWSYPAGWCPCGSVAEQETGIEIAMNFFARFEKISVAGRRTPSAGMTRRFSASGKSLTVATVWLDAKT